jgi:hypothetical protein
MLFVFLAACSGGPDLSDAGPDATGPGDSGGTDAAGPDAGSAETVVELVNASDTAVYIDGSWNRDCDPPYYELSQDGAPVFDRPTYLSCRCDRCESVACQGLGDAGPAVLVIAPRGSARIRWPRTIYRPGGEGCERGCLESLPAPAGDYRITVRYTREPPACPGGTMPFPADLPPPEGETELLTCDHSTLRCFVMTGLFDRSAAADFALSDTSVRVELP